MNDLELELLRDQVLEMLRNQLYIDAVNVCVYNDQDATNEFPIERNSFDTARIVASVFDYLLRKDLHHRMASFAQAIMECN
jgi:hypothetical protein